MRRKAMKLRQSESIGVPFLVNGREVVSGLGCQKWTDGDDQGHTVPAEAHDQNANRQRPTQEQPAVKDSVNTFLNLGSGFKRQVAFDGSLQGIDQLGYSQV